MPEKAAERQKAERRAKAFCHRAAVNGVPEEYVRAPRYRETGRAVYGSHKREEGM